MKCIKINATEKVVRVSDQEAHNLVKQGVGVYVTKSTWKAQVRARKVAA